MALIVIHGDDALELAASGADEKRVAGDWAGDGDTLRFRLMDGRLNNRSLLVAKKAAVAGVRIERGDGKMRKGVAETAHHVVQKPNLIENRGRIDVPKHVA